MEYSNFTFATVPVVVQVIFWDVPTTHCSAPLGAVIAKAPCILKLLLETSKALALFTSLIRALRVVEIVSGTVQAYVPALSVEAIIILG